MTKQQQAKQAMDKLLNSLTRERLKEVILWGFKTYTAEADIIFSAACNVAGVKFPDLITEIDLELS